ncbi:protein arginine kinase [Synoicihabitans lomoniglobus]|uniref:Protein arginine kinase n=1 Tax=Synoicihabitans lomoniglobus TaxID=2909285 RepID=A0AAF0CS98_9BACT|nr:protein arginine kinase [Opitutaceae bacterium LMO-M01]WED67098.1 protein arginine kinase [Opitutaceae bacterium LMO-M01]
MPLSIDNLISARAELTDNSSTKCPVVLMTRIRLARNLASHNFPGRAQAVERREVFAQCREAVMATKALKRGVSMAVNELEPLHRQVLVERHLISRELSNSSEGAGAIINKDQSVSVMINEEDHLRIQVLRNGLQLKRAWNAIDTLDTALEGTLDYAFSPRLGYITACPTNVGTGMRGSAMMHLPALVIAGQMEKVVRAVNQLGMVVRGLFGEGSDASGSMFQISNQTTLGESEVDIVKRLQNVLQSIVDHEMNARAKLLETNPAKLPDKIGRAYGVLKHGHIISSSEAMNLLSLVRLGVDLGYFPDELRTGIDRLFIEAQPGHISHRSGQKNLNSEQRDELRATHLREEFANFTTPGYASAVGEN